MTVSAPQLTDAAIDLLKQMQYANTRFEAIHVEPSSSKARLCDSANVTCMNSCEAYQCNGR